MMQSVETSACSIALLCDIHTHDLPQSVDSFVEASRLPAFLQKGRSLTPSSPILVLPYRIGDFVRCHTLVKLLRARDPSRSIDITTGMVAPLLDYMPGVRKGIVVDLPRKRVAFGEHGALAKRLRAEGYGQMLVMPRTWKSVLAPGAWGRRAIQAVARAGQAPSGARITAYGSWAGQGKSTSPKNRAT